MKGDGTASFTYDARGRMSQATRSGSTTAYAHNARGERVRKSGPLTPSGTNYFFYDEAGHLIGEYDKDGLPIAEFVWLEDIPVAVIKAGEIHHVYTDQLDTPRVILDRLNRVRWRWEAEPFGTTIPNENPAGLGAFAFNLRLPGQYFDKETGLHQNYFRDYDPATGRYVQSDPIGLAGGVNLYSYVDSDSVGWSDPDGLTRQRGNGNPRAPVGSPGQGSVWLGQQGVWFRGQFYPRLADPVTLPVSNLPRSRLWRDPGQICTPENAGYPQPISGHAINNWINRPDRDIPARDIINAINRGVPDMNSRPGTLTYYDPSTNTTVITNIFTGNIITFRRGEP